MEKRETIAAISTPQGEGGIGIIRISGDNAVQVVACLFSGSADLVKSPPRTAHYGWFVLNDKYIDEVVVTLFPGPKSYTGEDVVEISCHGGTYVTRAVLDALLASGAKAAGPGEFTQRAYLNGRMDLAKAEAVADLIKAKTEASRRVAVTILRGGLTTRLNEMNEQLIHICAFLELELDFGEEEIELTPKQDVKRIIEETIVQTDKLITTYNRGRVCREGVRMAIIGRTNVGKSSLLNALIEKERAIVTDIPGTTRDTIEDVLDMDGICFTIIDTAGIRDTADPVEKEGVRRSHQVIEDADIITAVFDGSVALKKDDQNVVRALQDCGKPVVAVLNKCDLKKVLDEDEILDAVPSACVRVVSAQTGEGIVGLISFLEELALKGGIPESGEVMITHARHHHALEKAKVSLNHALDTLSSGLSQEFIALDMRGAMDAFGEITGAVTSQDVLDKIFSDFCIGK